MTDRGLSGAVLGSSRGGRKWPGVSTPSTHARSTRGAGGEAMTTKRKEIKAGRRDVPMRVEHCGRSATAAPVLPTLRRRLERWYC